MAREILRADAKFHAVVTAIPRECSRLADAGNLSRARHPLRKCSRRLPVPCLEFRDETHRGRMREA
jgi:hypothetical protein